MNNNTTNVAIAVSLFVAVITTTLMSTEKTGTLGPADAVVLAGSDGDLTVKKQRWANVMG